MSESKDPIVIDPIVIDTINILMSTNIPGKNDISLTSKNIVGTSLNATRYNEYPYITKSVKIKGKFGTYDEILDFFFIKEVFTKNVNSISKSDDIDKPQLLKDKTMNKVQQKKAQKYFQKETDEYYVKILNYNINKMLNLLFTTYPLSGNIFNTIENTVENASVTKLNNILNYSYLNIESKPYTISKVIWINDIYNHYLSKRLVKNYNEFDSWKQEEKRNISNNLIENETKLENIILGVTKSGVNDSGYIPYIIKSDIETIGEYFMNVSNWNSQIQSLSTVTIRQAMGLFYAHLVMLQCEWIKEFPNSEHCIIDNNLNMNNYTMDPALLNKKGPAKKLIDKNEYENMKKRVIDINEFMKADHILRGAYNIRESREFMIELNRVSKIVIGSNLVSISSTVQDLIKDLYENNEKYNISENNLKYINDNNIIFGNDKYNNENFKTLSNLFIKDFELLKKNINFTDIEKDNFTFEDTKKIINKLQKPRNITIKDTFGIIYDNNNVKIPKYEIYTYIDLIDGKVTDQNKNNLDLCNFRDELLFIKFTQLQNNENKNIIQHDPLVKMLQDKPTKKNDTIATPKPIRGGAKTKNLYYELKQNKTRKKKL